MNLLMQVLVQCNSNVPSISNKPDQCEPNKLNLGTEQREPPLH